MIEAQHLIGPNAQIAQHCFDDMQLPHMVQNMGIGGRTQQHAFIKGQLNHLSVEVGRTNAVAVKRRVLGGVGLSAAKNAGAVDLDGDSIL